jgi:thioredoxin 2
MTTNTIRCPHCGRTNRVPATGTGRPRCGNCHNALPWIVDAGDADFADVAEKSSLFVVVDMWAPWCAPCRAVSPALERLAAEMAGRVKLVKVNVDAAQGLARRFRVQAVPTLLLMHDGKVVAEQAGAAPVEVLRKWVDDAIAYV